jgi:hypothetical protein
MHRRFPISPQLALTTGLAEELVLKSVADAKVAVNVVAAATAAVVLKAVAANTDARVIKLFDIC